MGGGGQDAQLGWELRPALDARIPPAAWTLSTIAFPAGYFWRGNAGSTAVRKAEAASAADGPLPVFYTFREFRSFGKGIMALGCCSDLYIQQSNHSHKSSYHPHNNVDSLHPFSSPLNPPLVVTTNLFSISMNLLLFYINSSYVSHMSEIVMVFVFV